MATLQILAIVTVLLPESFRGGCSFGERILLLSCNNLCIGYAIVIPVITWFDLLNLSLHLGKIENHIIPKQ